MDLSEFPKNFWPVIATPLTPNKLALRFVMVKEDFPPNVTQALIINYTPKTEDALVMGRLLDALGYSRLPAGSIEGVAQVLSSQMFPALEQIEKHPHDPKVCSAEKYEEMHRLFFMRQFNEQSVSELNAWKTHAEQMLAMHKKSVPDLAVYSQLIPSYYDRTLATIETQKVYIEKLWDRLIDNFKTNSYLTPVPYVGLRIRSLDKSVFGKKDW